MNENQKAVALGDLVRYSKNYCIEMDGITLYRSLAVLRGMAFRRVGGGLSQIEQQFDNK